MGWIYLVIAGAVGAATYGIFMLGEDRSILRVMCFALILAGIVGLKLLSGSKD